MERNITGGYHYLEWFCTGVLISHDFVLALAECGLVFPMYVVLCAWGFVWSNFFDFHLFMTLNTLFPHKNTHTHPSIDIHADMCWKFSMWLFFHPHLFHVVAFIFFCFFLFIQKRPFHWYAEVNY